MFPKDRKKWLYQEEARLTKYQHQHRGLSFQKLLLPPVTHREVKLVGRDSHIYKGSILRIPEDQLPPEVDEKSIDEEALYKEIRDMNFPPVPEQEPLGPSRRIEGTYTLAKRMALAPVHVDCTEHLDNILVLGKDGGIYKGKGKDPSKLELDKKLGGTKRSILKTRGYVEPSLVSLHTSGNPPLYGKSKESLIELPTAEIGNMISMVKEKSTKGESETIPDTTDQNETTELEREDIQSEDDEASEKSDETDTENSTEADKSPEEGEEEDSTGEGTGGTSKESDSEALKSDQSQESNEYLGTETTEDSGTKASEEAEKEESPETDELSSAEETDELPSAVETDELPSAVETDELPSVVEAEEIAE